MAGAQGRCRLARLVLRTFPSFHFGRKAFQSGMLDLTRTPDVTVDERQQVARMSAILSCPLEYASLAHRLLLP